MTTRKMSTKQRRNTSDNPMSFSLAVALVLLSFATLTFLHDPVLHSIPAYLFGWNINDWYMGFMTGYTSVEAIGATPTEIWIFYMTPSITLVIMSVLAIIVKPIRLVIIPSLILFTLNIASMNPTITGADSQKALDVLVTSTLCSNDCAYIIHYGIFLAALTLYAFMIWIIVEDDSYEAVKRGQEVYR